MTGGTGDRKNPVTVASAKVEKFLRLLRNFGTSKVAQPTQLAQSYSEYNFSSKSALILL
jgi:hypothetical protein